MMPEKTSIERIENAAKAFIAMLEDQKLQKAALAITHNDPVQQQAFSDPKGVGIGQFAQFFNLPVSTIRHYVELGLIEPITLNGKFRFVFYNISELEFVRQWVYLGMKLEDIVARNKSGVMTTSDSEGKVMMRQKITDPAMVETIQEFYRREGNPALLSKEASLELTKLLGLTPEIPKRRGLADCDAIIEQLEVKLSEVRAQLERAKNLRSQLRQTYDICDLSDL